MLIDRDSDIGDNIGDDKDDCSDGNDDDGIVMMILWFLSLISLTNRGMLVWFYKGFQNLAPGS